MNQGVRAVVAVLVLNCSVSFGQTLSQTPADDAGAGPLKSWVMLADDEPEKDNPPGRIWVSADYLLWWLRNGPVNTPLVTTGSTKDAVPGALGQPGTRVLFGDQPLNEGALSGLRVQAGFDFTPAVGVEGSYFFLGNNSVQFQAASDAGGNPVIGRPVLNNQSGLQDVYATSFPGRWSGSTDVTAHSVLQGYEFNLDGHLIHTERSKLDLLVGFRALDLNEDLEIQDQLTPLAPGNLTFLGNPVSPPSMLSDFDHFHTSNQFYGGQLGVRWQGFLGRFSVDLTSKLALGTTQQLVTISGASTLTTPGAAPITAPGGILAQTNNIGRYYRSEFSAVPELGLNLGWQVTPHMQAIIGYNFLYWTNVVRPGNQLDNIVNPALPPTDQLFGNGLGQNHPAFTFHSSDLWTQGITFGVIFRF